MTAEVPLHFLLIFDTHMNKFYWLRAGRSGDRIQVGAIFSHPVQTGPEAHLDSYTVGFGSFPGVKRPGGGSNLPPPCSTEVKKE